MTKLELTNDEHRALTMLLRNHLTGGALDALGLQGVCDRLSATYRVMWEYGSSKEKVPSTEDYSSLVGRIDLP